MKEKLKNELDRSISNQLDYIAGNIENDLQKIKNTALLFSMNSDLVISAATITRTPKDISRLLNLYNNITLVTKALPYDAQTFIYFKNIDRVIASGMYNSLGGFMDEALSMDIETFYNRIKKHNDDFSPQAVNLSNIEDELAIFKQFILYVHPVGNNCYVMVKIDKQNIKKHLYVSDNIVDSIVLVTNTKGQVFASSAAIDGNMLNAANLSDGSSKKTYNGSYSLISRKMYNSGLNYNIFYSSSYFQKWNYSVNIYTYIMLGIFTILNLFILFLNVFIYKPVKTIISKYCDANNSMYNEFDMIEKTITELHTRNNDFSYVCTQLKNESEQNILRRLITRQEQTYDESVIRELNDKVNKYIVLTSIIEDSFSNKAQNEIGTFEKLLSEECTYTKIIFDLKLDVYIIWNADDKNMEGIIQHLYKSIDNGSMFFLAGLSHVFNDVKRLNEAFRQSTKAIYEHKVDFSSVLNVYTYDASIEIARSCRLKLSIDDEQELVNYTLRSNIKSTASFFDTVILDKIKDSSYGQFKGLYRYLADLCDIIIQSKNIYYEQVFNGEVQDISNVYNPRLLHETMKNMYLGIAGFCTQQKDSLYERIIIYVKANYMQDLTLTSIADQFQITPVYLSSYFKKVSGTNLITYLNKVRIESALTLMKNKKNLKFNEISQAVGYPNADTFTRQFKKIIGVTPNKYEEIL